MASSISDSQDRQPEDQRWDRFAWLNALRDDRKLSALDRLVGLMLWSRANDYGECWPSKKTQAADCASSIRTVDRSANNLARQKWIEVIPRTTPKGDPDSNLYRLLPHPPVTVTPPPVTVTPPPAIVAVPPRHSDALTEQGTDQPTSKRSSLEGGLIAAPPQDSPLPSPNSAETVAVATALFGRSRSDDEARWTVDWLDSPGRRLHPLTEQERRYVLTVMTRWPGWGPQDMQREIEAARGGQPRGMCARCGWTYALQRSDGTVCLHKGSNPHGCPGSHQQPVVALYPPLDMECARCGRSGMKIAADRLCWTCYRKRLRGA